VNEDSLLIQKTYPSGYWNNGPHSYALDGYVVEATPLAELQAFVSFPAAGKWLAGTVAALPTGNSPRTIETVFRSNASPGDWQIVANWGDLVGGHIWATEINILGRDEIGSSSWDLNGNIQINDGSWHRQTVTYDGTSVSIYVDGILDVTGSNTYSTSLTPLYVGAGTFGGQTFYGDVASVTIWNRALTTDEVTNQSANASAANHFQFYGGGSATGPFADTFNPSNVLTLSK
jgi:hypothetical protein